MTGLIGSRWTSLARASCSLPSRTIVSSALLFLSASIDSWPGQGDVHRLGAVAVHDGGDLVVAADLARGALAELGTGLGGRACGRTRWTPGEWKRMGQSVLDAGRGTERPAHERPADPPDLRAASVDHGCVDRIVAVSRTALAGATSLAEATPRV